MCWLKIFLSALTIVDGIWKIRINADLRLPLIQISHDEYGPDYPEINEEVHLEDFFWTGSGDAPPEYLKKMHTGISKGKDVIMKTETVVATVYVDGNNEIDIPICLDCPTDNGMGRGPGFEIAQGFPPLNYSATDRRYWLLTVMSGFYTEKDNPMLEEKLARLYRLAFTRQQSRHLGISGAQQAFDTVLSRDRMQYTDLGTSTSVPLTSFMDPDEDFEVFDMTTKIISTSLEEKNLKHTPLNPKSELETSSEEEKAIEHTTPAPAGSEDYAAYVTVFPWEYIQQNGANEKYKSDTVVKSDERSEQVRSPFPFFHESRVRILLHNITQITEEDIEKGSLSREADEKINTNIDRRPLANQTELIYSVFVDNRPVLAITAASDMELVSENEAVNVIGKEIFMKAEPYLREPQATPLAPATRSGPDNFLTSIQNNPALVSVSSVAIFLLLLLLVALFLMGRGRSRATSTTTSRLENRNELLSESHSERPTDSVLDTERTNIQSRDVGIQNFSFENETEHRGEPRIHFPGPPDHRSRRSSLTSSDNTSDSSVYCPINPPTSDVQKFLDEKAATLFDAHKRRPHQYDRVVGREDAIYTSVVSEKKYDKTRHKKRRYLTENRVGSVETSPAQKARNGESGDVAMESFDEDGAKYINYERTETFNPHNNYHRNKIIHQKSALKVKDSQRTYEEHELRTNEAINKEIIKALQSTEKSSDSGSIGSFLSMSSVKAFPKQALPEPLNRVLDPVFLTYYDNVDSSVNKTTGQKTQNKGKERICTVATIESFPEPKQPPRQHITTASQSDNPDPGVLGPVVWERHKKSTTETKDTDAVRKSARGNPYSPIHDPATVRTQYADLIDGALHMFSSHDDLPMPLPTRDFTNNRKKSKNGPRGSSAGVPGNKQYNIGYRPSTAQPDKTPNSNQSTVPPSPTSGVWGGSSSLHGSQASIVRPLSAGPFHHPETNDYSISNEDTSLNRRSKEISAAPIIEAIQTELRKLKEDKTVQQYKDF